MKLHLIAAAIAVFAFATPAKADTEICTEITALPFNISTQGVYCLKKNLNVNLATGNAITVSTGNVTIDFNSFRVNNQAATTNSANGVFAQNRKNVSLRNGFLRGFRFCLFVEETTFGASSTILIDDMKMSDCTLNGIRVEGSHARIRNNVVIDTGGNPFDNAAAIDLREGSDSVISGNLVSGVFETAQTTGINLTSVERVRVFDNTITQIGDSGDDSGIRANSVNKGFIHGNTLLNDFGNGEFGINGEVSVPNFNCLANNIGGYVTPLHSCGNGNEGNNTILYN